MVRSRCSEPPDFRPASWSGHPTGSRCHPSPIARCQHSPTSPDASSTRVHIEFPLIAITIKEIYPPDSRLWRSLTGIITVNTSNYNRNTYIYYYIYLEKHHISEYTHIIAIYTNLLFLHFFPIFSLYQKTQNWRFLSDSKKHTFF
jgi:hypothetical protein